MVACGLLVVGGLAAIAAWGGDGFEPPAPTERPPSTREALRRYLWYVTIALGAGLGAGLLMAGAGGRLAMRLVAVTAGEQAQGRLTEADQVVGLITLGGTIGFIVFVGLFFGLASALLYLLLHRLLPAGRLGGALYGILLLVWFGSLLEPLRPDNPDFDIVGPGWVSVLTFGTLVVAHGMLVHALAARYSRGLPLMTRERTTLMRYAPLLAAAAFWPLLVPLGLGALVIAGPGRLGDPGGLLRSPRTIAVGRVVAVILSLIALPRFVQAAADILGRGPAG